MTSIVSYRIVEITQHLFGQLDNTLLNYYRERWPTEVEDFTPVTWRYPQPNHYPLQMIADSYTLIKSHCPNKQDQDILTAIVLFYYSTVILEYYALKEATHYTIYLQQKYISDDGSLLVTQDNQIFRVLDNPSGTSSTPDILELQKVVVKTNYTRKLQFQHMPKEQRKQILVSLSRHLQGKAQEEEEEEEKEEEEDPSGNTISFQSILLPQRFFLDTTDPHKCILTRSGNRYSKTPATVDGFFRRFQNAEVNSLLFQISCDDLEWARQLRRQYHGLYSC
jgi:hypothetical protein